MARSASCSRSWAATCRRRPPTPPRRRCGAASSTWRRLFAGIGVELEFARGLNPWRFDSAEHYLTFMESHYGPTLKARERLTAEGRWNDCRQEILAMAERRNQAADGSLEMWAEYLVVIGHKAA